MAKLIDTSLWIDFTRASSPKKVKQFIVPHILDPLAHLAEPVVFEVLRYASPREAAMLTRQFETFPLLPTPPNLWDSAREIGQRCRAHGLTAASLDLLIASVALHHDATLVTLDEDFLNIARHSDLKVELLRRPA